MSNQDSTVYKYAAVIHMTDADAARHLGKTVHIVRDYRARHPHLEYRPAPEPVTRPGIITLRMPVYEPSRAVSNREGRVMDVSLPAPPWGGLFERQGVRV